MLFVPVSAPWMRASEAIEFARAVKAPRNLAIHDRVYSEAGLGIVDGHMNAFLPKEGLEYVRLPDGAGPLTTRLFTAPLTGSSLDAPVQSSTGSLACG